MTRNSRTGVRVVSVLCALIVMAIYTLHIRTAPSNPQVPPANSVSRGLLSGLYTRLITSRAADVGNENYLHPGRHLLSLEDGSNLDDSPTTPPSGDDDSDNNCTAPRGDHHGYNDSCAFVLDQCQDAASLVDYLAFVLCDFANIQVWLHH